MNSPSLLPLCRAFRAAVSALLCPLLLAVPALGAIQLGQNLLVNGSADASATTGWMVTGGGALGTVWSRTANGGYDSTGGYFITSYGTCSRSQTIDLIAQGLTAEELDSAPAIRVSEAISSTRNNTTADSYYIRVELRDAAGAAVASWNVGSPTARKTATTSWVLESFTFRNYGPGVRSIYFEDGGTDGGYWAGNYGTFHDAARVEFSELPVTGIAAAPAAFAANVPPGGIVAQLQATDADSASHTFVLEAEPAGTSTQPLLAAAAPDWRYYDSATEPAANWVAPDFDDSAWLSGQAPLGYDSAGADTWKNTNTVSYGGDAAAKPLTTWYRKTFTVTDASAFTGLAATLMVDDGCVAYLNGQELFRDGVAEGITVTSATPANRTVGGTDEGDYDPVVIPAEKLPLLQTGLNTLAIEVHQDKVSSSDISIDMTLAGTVTLPGNAYDNDLFEITGSELRLKNGSAPLAPGNYTVRVRATDPEGNTAVRLVTLERTANVFTSAPSAITLTPSTLAENTAPGALAGSLTATDADTGDVHAFALVAGPGGEDNALFTLNGNRLIAAQPVDYEARTALSILVSATDSAGLSLTVPLTLSITDDTAEDADGDGLSEAEEDLNNDGVLDAGETDPALADTDGDGFNDRVERQNASDPRNPLSVPATVELPQLTSHTTGDSWLTAASWDGGTAPQSFHITVTNGLTLRPPPSADPVFPGAAARLTNGAVFRLKHTGTLTIPRIILDTATLQHGMTVPLTVGGGGSRLEVPTTATIDTTTYPLILTAGLSGSGAINVTGSSTATAPVSNGRLELQAPAQGFTGEITLNAPELVIAHPAALGDIRTLGVNSGILRLSQAVSIPGAQLAIAGTGQIALTTTLTVGGFSVNGLPIPAGTYNAAQLIAAGVPSTAIEDGGGSLVIGSGTGLDTDGDGWSDADELLAGTDPNDAASVLRLNTATPGFVAGTWALTWTAVPGILYTVQYTSNLDTAWLDLGTVTPDTTSGSFDAVIPPPAGPRAFFRLIIR